MSGTDKQNRKVITIAGIVVIGMFGFGFALVPLYSLICDSFGLNGRITGVTDGSYDASAKAQKALAKGVDKSREVTVQFLVNRNRQLNWEFKAMTRELQVHPGEVKVVNYYVKNRTDKTIIAQAIPSVAPGQAAKYFTKIECFCFTQQTLKPGEEKQMPLRFVVNPDLPKKISTVTLAYKFFDTHANQSGDEVSAQGAQSVLAGVSAN